METGSKCICQHDDWFNAFGDAFTALHKGDRLTVRASKRAGGARFLSFNETPEDHFFLEQGFVPMRALN